MCRPQSVRDNVVNIREVSRPSMVPRASKAACWKNKHGVLTTKAPTETISTAVCHRPTDNTVAII